MSGAGAVSRRRFLGVAGAAGAGALVATATTLGTDVLAAPPAAASVLEGIVPFHGLHQAGIVTPAQDKLLMASFDVTTNDKNDLVDMLREWTRAARRMTAGRPVGDDNTDPDAPPDDTGESEGLDAASLTVTFGFGATLFERDGVDRFGLQAQRPEALVDLPSFAGDEIEPARSGGDLVVQACANDPQVTFHAIRNLTRIGRGVVVLRWSQSGFGRTSSTDSAQATPRNLMGFKDGTNNLVAEDDAALRTHTWVGEPRQPGLDARRLVHGRPPDPHAHRGLGPLHARRPGSHDRAGQEQRRAARQEPEHDVVDLAARQDGELVIAHDAHIRLAAPSVNDGVRLLRRGYSFTDGINPVTNQLDAGLFFIAFQRDPRQGFIPVQQKLATDALNEYIRHTGSGVFAVPPGVQSGGFVGETLFT